MSVKHHPPDHPAHAPRHAGRWIVGALVATGLYFAGHAVHDTWQERSRIDQDARALTGGIPDRGRHLLRTAGCIHCHVIPGVPGEGGLIGPPLTRVGERMYIAGVLTNTPDNLVRWIVNPKAVDPMTAMPAVGVTEQQARHIAAYLYTVR
jgi:cytochrome c